MRGKGPVGSPSRVNPWSLGNGPDECEQMRQTMQQPHMTYKSISQWSRRVEQNSLCRARTLSLEPLPQRQLQQRQRH